MIAGNAALPVTTINSTSTETGHQGNGFARITLLDQPPEQTAAAHADLNKTDWFNVQIDSRDTAQASAQLKLNGTDKDTTNGVEYVRLATADVFTAANTSSSATAVGSGNYYLEIRNAAVGGYTFQIRARRYWSGTKRFYVQVKDVKNGAVNSAGGTDVGVKVFFTFTATCRYGALSMPNKETNEYKFGDSTTTNAASAETGAGTVIYNPVHGSGARKTLFLKKPLSTNKDTVLDIGNLFTTTNNHANEEVVHFADISYDRNRYAKANNAAEPITNAGGQDSSYFTDYTKQNAITYTSYANNATSTVNDVNAAYGRIALRGVANVPAGPNYYRITVTVRLRCKNSGENFGTTTFDIVYRVDNTRPTMLDPAPHAVVKSGESVTLNLSDICRDPDGNALTIQQVIVPDHEFVALDQYGNVKKESDGGDYYSAAYDRNYNVGKPSDKYAETDPAVTTTAQTARVTDFKANWLYRDAHADADNTFGSQAGEGNSNISYAGYYVNKNRTSITVLGNKATRNLYRADRGASANVGHFYIMLRLQDEGDTSDTGIWFPVAITVTSAAPTEANSPSISGNAGDVYYFSPISMLLNGSYATVGTDNYAGGNASKWNAKMQDGKSVSAFAFDRDNMSVDYAATNPNRTITLGGKTITFASANASNEAYGALRDPVFIANNTYNNNTFAAFSQTHNDITNVADGFKEFYTVEKVDLYADVRILALLTDAQINYLYDSGMIDVYSDANGTFVKYAGMKVTLNKYTMGKYLSFYVDVFDSFSGDTSPAATRLRIAVKVNNTETSARTNIGSPYNFNTRPNAAYPLNNTWGGSAYRENMNDGSVMFTFRTHKMTPSEYLYISPYDLLYNQSTYSVNYGKEGQNAKYNTVPNGEGYSELVQGLNKNIAVMASDTPEGAPTQVNDFHFERFRIADTNPRVTNGGIYASVEYVDDTPDNKKGTDPGYSAEYFKINAKYRSPEFSPVYFTYSMTSSTGAIINVTVQIRVDNSLPTKRVAENKVFYLTADTALGNSSTFETDKGTASNTNTYYVINDESYNVREFTLDDLFDDVDGDSIQFADNLQTIYVGTLDKNGNFVQFGDEYGNNNYITARVGYGSGVRAGSGRIILEGKSSTLGIPGGLWIKFSVTDNYGGSSEAAEYMFQVEVVNSTPKYADMTGENAMDNKETSPNAKPDYAWGVDSEKTDVPTNTAGGSVYYAMQLTDNPNRNVYAPEQHGLENNATPIKRIEKPRFIASNAQSMVYYRDAMTTALTGTGLSFNYTADQVRVIAQDADGSQGLALYGATYKGNNDTTTGEPQVVVHNKPEFGADDENAVSLFGTTVNNAVAVTRMYTSFPDNTSEDSKLEYYTENNVIQILFFNEDGERVTGNAANNATNWVIAFNFTDTPATFDVRIRLRDVNNPVVNGADGSFTITTGGFSAFDEGTKLLWKGDRGFSQGLFDGTYPEPNYNESALANGAGAQNGTGVFGFSVAHKTLGLYNNFARWKTGDPETDGLWSQTDAQGTYDYRTVNSNWEQIGLFRYDGIAVPAEKGSTVAVPVSYFAWAVANDVSTKRGTAQEKFAWYDIPDNTTSANSPLKTTNIGTILSVMTLSDGVNTWTGDQLRNNGNPYINIEFAKESDFGDAGANLSNKGSDFPNYKTNYLYGQQRFFGRKDSEIPVVSNTAGAGKFYEDTVGLLFSKNSLRSVGNLTLTIRMALWEKVESSVSISGYAKNPNKMYDPIEVSVPVHVSNSALRVDQDDNATATNHYAVNTSKDTSGGNTIVLTTNYELDKIPSAVHTDYIRSYDTVTDQWAANTAYREDMYFLSASFMGKESRRNPVYAGVNDTEPFTSTSLTSEQLAHIVTQYKEEIDATRKERIADYFGLLYDNSGAKRDAGAVAADMAKLAIADVTEGGQTISCVTKDGTPLSINPYFNAYFFVSPVDYDAKSINIQARRITTFDYKALEDAGKSQDEINAEAAKRGLKVAYNAQGKVDYCYYPLKVIVYDRLTVGYSANTTTFTESSFDVITLDVRVRNSAPTVVSRNLPGKIQSVEATINGVKGTYQMANRSLSLAKDESQQFSFADLFSDADMVQERGYYLLEDTLADGIDKDTGDYPAQIEGKRVQVQFLSATGTATGKPITGTNQWDAIKNPTGAVACETTDTGLTVTVKNRAYGFKPSETAANIVLVFTDRYGSYAYCLIKVEIANKAPTLSANAQRTTNITMYTGDYFTLYATPFESFVTGANISTTVGNGTGVNNYNGTYFTNEPSVSSKNLTGGVEQWSYHEGVRADSSNGFTPASSYPAYSQDNVTTILPDFDLQTRSANNGANENKGTRRNIGYMSIANDDAPWTLRFKTNDPVKVSSDMVQATLMNEMLYEGSSTVSGSTAVLFEALGAVQNATVSITLYDGHSSVDGLNNVNTLTYTFNITVISSPPTAITRDTESGNVTLGRALKEEQPDSVFVKENRLQHGTQTTDNVYTLEMYEGEQVTLKTKDFASDIDRGDDDNMYLVPLTGDIPFAITSYDKGQAAQYQNISNYISLTPSTVGSGSRYTRFTVDALNFHNYSTSENHMFDTVTFYICDPSATLNGTNVDGNKSAVKIVLNIYVYPNKPVGDDKTVGNVKMYGVTEAQQPGNGPFPVQLVSKPGEGGIFEDVDAGSTLTQYSVKVYTYTARNDKGEVEILKDSPLGVADQLVAQYTVQSKGSNTTSTYTTDNSKILNDYFGAITFSADGSTMFVVPVKATNKVKYISGSDIATGISLYVEIEKFVERGGDNYGPGSAQNPGYTASRRVDVTISNSAPTEVGDTPNNVGLLENMKGETVPNRKYRWIEGVKGDAWTYYLHNQISQKDEALFYDPDNDDITYAGADIVKVYTLDDEGNPDKDYTGNAEVMASVNGAYSLQDLMYPYKGTDLHSLRITILHKVDLPAESKGKTAYIDLRIKGTDGKESAYSTVTLGIRNSAPAFRATDDAAVTKYKTNYDSYRRDDATGNAELTLYLNKDNSEKFLSSDGALRIPLSDLIADADFEVGSSNNLEKFKFVSPGNLATGRADASVISNNSAQTLWLDNGKFDVSMNAQELAKKRFTVRVSDDNNTALIVRVQSYDRGAREQFVLMAEDSSGARTGVLTVTLVVGNSAPISKIAAGETSGNIVMAGKATGEFERTTFNISQFVRDNNPVDNDTVALVAPVEPSTYLTIADWIEGDIDPDGEFKDDAGNDGGDGNSSAGGEGGYLPLVNFFVNSNQTFTVAPIAGRYGKQIYTLIISDNGNTGNNDGERIEIDILIQITKNPSDMIDDVNDISVYWYRTKDITARDLFDNPSTPKNEGEGFLIQSVSLPDKSSSVEVSKNTETGIWQVKGLAINPDGVQAVASVVVGSEIVEGMQTYEIPFKIIVAENGRPVFKSPYGEGTTLFTKGMFDDDGIAYVFIDDIFTDNEGDKIELISASSKKSTLIGVTADTQNNRLQFKFKANGTSTIKVRVKDAVAIYAYEFKVGTNERSDPNFFIGIISRVQGNPLIFIVIACAVLLLLIILIAILAAARKKKKMREEIEALLVSEMELEEQMLKLAAGPSPTFYQAYGYLPPNPGAQTNPNMMLGSGQGAPNPNAAIGLNPGMPNQGTPMQNGNTQLPSPDDFSDDDL